MDSELLLAVLEGDVSIDELSIAERLAFGHEIIAARVKPRDEFVPPARFLVPPAIEAYYRRRAS